MVEFGWQKRVYFLCKLYMFLKSSSSRNSLKPLFCLYSQFSTKLLKTRILIFILWCNHWIWKQAGDCSTADSSISQWNSYFFHIGSKEKSCLLFCAALQPVGFQKFLEGQLLLLVSVTIWKLIWVSSFYNFSRSFLFPSEAACAASSSASLDTEHTWTCQMTCHEPGSKTFTWININSQVKFELLPHCHLIHVHFPQAMSLVLVMFIPVIARRDSWINRHTLTLLQKKRNTV